MEAAFYLGSLGIEKAFIEKDRNGSCIKGRFLFIRKDLKQRSGEQQFFLDRTNAWKSPVFAIQYLFSML